MAPRINSIGLCVIVALCILLIFASNRISFLSSSSPSSSAASSEFSRTFNLPNDRFYQMQVNDNSLGMNLYANSRAGGKYNKIMHPHNTEQRSQYDHRKYGGSNNNNNNVNVNQLNAESATVLSTNNDVIINTTVRVEDVLDAQRQRIAMKMKDFEYTEEMQGGLSSLTPETNGRPLRSGKFYRNRNHLKTNFQSFFFWTFIAFSNCINVAFWINLSGRHSEFDASQLLSLRAIAALRHCAD